MLTAIARVHRLPHARDLPLPRRQTPGSAGMDLAAALDAPVTLQPGERKLIPTGYRISLDGGLEAQIRPRSGLALKHGVTVLNSPGTIDPDYRGEISVLLVNHGDAPFEIRHGDRIAQMVVTQFVSLQLHETDELTATTRGSGGYGSTGLASDGTRG